ncbi:glycosyltransferase family 4 protein [Novosphingobium rosa]|uniref:glycosyltransferase family 4 protein n=1 Tax=Novosphingobium rosa TaxID=76978 RepID=UPI001470B6C8|nr:glycosyltransferase [Novosphingobium rosa]
MPLGTKPYVVSFEGELPRVMNGDVASTSARKRLRKHFFSRRCRGLYPISAFALRLLRSYARDWPEVQEDRFQPQIMYPSIQRRGRPKQLNKGELVLTFVGGQWARKGGAVCARLSRLLTQRGLKHCLHIISSLDHGPHIYTDTSVDFYKSDIDLLRAPEVTLHGAMSNADALALMDKSDFVLLPTLDDSFGFSLLEAMAGGTPCIATRICAIPEVIDDGQDGILVDMPCDANGRWAHVYEDTPGRLNPAYSEMLDTLFSDLALTIADRLEALVESGGYEAMSHQALSKIETRFDAELMARRWNDVYAQALSRNI